jgi:hypothetical protein
MIATLIDPASMNSLIVWLTPLMLAVLTTIQLLNGWLARKQADAAKQATVTVAEQVDKVARVAAAATKQSQEQSEKILILADKTHTLVNSQTGIMLSTIYEQSLRLFKLTGLPEDQDKVDAAKKKLNEHEAKQHAVDMKEQQ